MWFFPKKKLKVHVFCSPGIPVRTKSVKKAAAFVPDWWKKLPATYTLNGDNPLAIQPTMKTCVGFTNLYKHGLIVPLWCDLELLIGKIGTTNYRYQYADAKSEAFFHEEPQRTGFVKDTEFQHIKLNSPWFIYCEEKIDFVVMSPLWNLINYKTVNVMPGVFTPKVVNSTNMNLIIARTEEEQRISFPAGTPMLHFIPLSERKIELVYHFEDAKDRFLREGMFRNKFVKSYDAALKQDPKDVVCPVTRRSGK